MNKIYTTYYTKAWKLDGNRFYFIQISNSVPKKWDYNTRPVIKLKELIPQWSLVEKWQKKEINWEQYTESYKGNISDYMLEKAWNFIKAKAEDKEVLLICYEKDGHCHRHIVADILNERYNQSIEELDM